MKVFIQIICIRRNSYRWSVFTKLKQTIIPDLEKCFMITKRTTFSKMGHNRNITVTSRDVFITTFFSDE